MGHCAASAGGVPRAQHVSLNREPQRQRIYDRDGGHCRYCGAVLSRNDGWHVDHVIPRSQGGGESDGNLALACRDGNLSKGDRTPAEWAAAGGRLLDEWKQPYVRDDAAVRAAAAIAYAAARKRATTPGTSVTPGTCKRCTARAVSELTCVACSQQADQPLPGGTEESGHTSIPDATSAPHGETLPRRAQKAGLAERVMGYVRRLWRMRRDRQSDAAAIAERTVEAAVWRTCAEHREFREADQAISADQLAFDIGDAVGAARDGDMPSRQ